MGSESGNLEIATNDAVAADMGGSIAFGARYSGTAQANFAVIKAGLVGSYGGYLSLGTRPDGGSMTERIRITSDGNVGIGSTAPWSIATVVDTTARSNSSIGGTAASFSIAIASGNELAFSQDPSGVSAMWMQARNTATPGVVPLSLNPLGGSVGIGTMTPKAKLEVATGSDTTNGQPAAYDYNFFTVGIGGSTTAGSVFVSYNQTTHNGFIGSLQPNVAWGNTVLQPGGGKVGVGMVPVYQLQLSSDSASKPTSSTWTITSDSRVKTNIRPFTDGLDLVHALTPVAYELNGKAGLPAGSTGIGLIAQDVKDIAPYMVGTYKAVLDAPQTTTLLADVSETDTDFTVQDDTLVNTANVKYEVGDEQFTGCVVLPPTTTGQKMIRCGRGPGAKPLSAGNVLTASEAPQDIFNLQASAMPWILVNALKDLEKQTLVPMDVTDVLPACSEQTRGQQKFIGDDLLGDSVKLCGRNAAGAYAWKVTVNF
jgi:hypothetical protein